MRSSLLSGELLRATVAGFPQDETFMGRDTFQKRSGGAAMNSFVKLGARQGAPRRGIAIGAGASYGRKCWPAFAICRVCERWQSEADDDVISVGMFRGKRFGRIPPKAAAPSTSREKTNAPICRTTIACHPSSATIRGDTPSPLRSGSRSSAVFVPRIPPGNLSYTPL